MLQEFPQILIYHFSSTPSISVLDSVMRTGRKIKLDGGCGFCYLLYYQQAVFMKANDIWQTALGELQLQVTEANYRTWLKETKGLFYHSDRFVVGVPNAFISEWLEQRLKPVIEKTLARIAGHALEVQFQVYPGAEEGIPSDYRFQDRPKFNPKYTFSSFIVGSSNRLAHAAALGVAEKPGTSYNPLFIYGGVGLGKTHLLHAIGHVVIKTIPQVIYVTAEQFTNELILGIRERRTEDFRNKYRGVDVLLIDDIQFIAGKEQTQEALFHTFNVLHNANSQIVLSSDRSPRALPLLEERLRSRFEWGLITDIQPPDLETRVAILEAKAEEQKAKIPSEVLYFIARRIPSNIRELEGALNHLIAYAEMAGSPPTPELAAQALTEIATIDAKQRLTPELIINTVAKYYKLDPDTIRGKRRDKPIVLARQIAMYLLREETQCPWTEIGRELGGKDHSTVLHGYEKITGEIEANYALYQEVLQIRELLYSKASG
jgi:chromosomal replication initiator protein